MTFEMTKFLELDAPIKSASFLPAQGPVLTPLP